MSLNIKWWTLPNHILEYRLPNFYDSQINMTTHLLGRPKYFVFRNNVSPKYGHEDLMGLYPFHHLICNHRAITSPHHNMCYVSLMIVPCYDEEEKI